MPETPQLPKQPCQDSNQERARRPYAARSAGHRNPPDSMARSQLDVTGVDLDLTADEIVDLVREGRERG